MFGDGLTGHFEILVVRGRLSGAPVQTIPIGHHWRDSGANNLPPQHIGLFVVVDATAAVLAFITSFDELVVAMAGSQMTLPKKMFDNIRMEINPTIAAVSVLQILRPRS